MKRKIIVTAMFAAAVLTVSASAEEAPAVDTVRADTARVAVTVENVQADTAQTAVAADNVQADTASASVADTAQPNAAAQEAAAVDTARPDTVPIVAAPAPADTAAPPAAAAVPAAAEPEPEDYPSMLAEPMDFGARARAGDIDQRVMRGVYLFSLRPEFLAVFGEVSSAGIVGEIGLVDRNGLLFSLDVSGGINYFGAGLNVGHSFNSASSMKNAIGYSFGYYNTDIVTKFESESGKLLKRYTGNNVGVTGLFWKIKWGRTGHLDVTNRVMFGYKSGAVWYDEDDGVYKEDGFTASYSVSAGYTFVRRR